MQTHGHFGLFAGVMLHQLSQECLLLPFLPHLPDPLFRDSRHLILSALSCHKSLLPQLLGAQLDLSISQRAPIASSFPCRLRIDLTGQWGCVGRHTFGFCSRGLTHIVGILERPGGFARCRRRRVQVGALLQDGSCQLWGCFVHHRRLLRCLGVCWGQLCWRELWPSKGQTQNEPLGRLPLKAFRTGSWRLVLRSARGCAESDLAALVGGVPSAFEKAWAGLADWNLRLRRLLGRLCTSLDFGLSGSCWRGLGAEATSRRRGRGLLRLLVGCTLSLEEI
mmetsp:Transcript_56920/g.133089  ORF Transcript_56920/g.133089 Transcript_56920/m.133089 type:complete len:279 (+) Transcript_56920:194-1030(+)